VVEMFVMFVGLYFGVWRFEVSLGLGVVLGLGICLVWGGLMCCGDLYTGGWVVLGVVVWEFVRIVCFVFAFWCLRYLRWCSI